MKGITTLCLPLLLILSFCGSIPLAGQTPDADGAKDPQLFNRMPGYYISSATDNDFNRYEFRVGREKTEPVEGRYCYRGYAIQNDKTAASALAIVRNYENAAKSVGGQVVFKPSGGEAVVKISKNGTETWAFITTNPDGKAYDVYIIEKQAMEQNVVANADSMAQSIKQSGKVALYGILFDTGKSEIKPESEAAIQEIAKLLKAEPRMKLYVVGHTDNVGTLDANLKLSKERADATVKALATRHGIPAARLVAFGSGPVTPVATNATEEGRAQNRRVELVEQ